MKLIINLRFNPLHIFFALLLIFSSVEVSGQEKYYNLVRHYSGYDVNTLELDTIAAIVSSTIPVPDGEEEFKVFSYDFYPVMAYVDEKEGYKYQFSTSQSELKGSHDYYLAIYKFFNDKVVLEYQVDLKLPVVSAFDTLTGIERAALEGYILKEIKDQYKQNQNNFDAEKKGILALKNGINKILGKSLDKKMMNLAGFTKLELDPNMQIRVLEGDDYGSPTGRKESSSTLRSSSHITEFSKIILKTGSGVIDSNSLLFDKNQN